MQIDLVPELLPSGGYEIIVTAMDVFSRYLFAFPTSNQVAKTRARVIINIMTKMPIRRRLAFLTRDQCSYLK